MTEEKLSLINYERKERENANNSLIETPLRMKPNPSNNFPSPQTLGHKARKSNFNFHPNHASNTFDSALDLDRISGLFSPTNNGYHDNKYKYKYKYNNDRIISPNPSRSSCLGLYEEKKGYLRTKGTDRNLQCRLIGINYDSQFGLDEEEHDIKQTNFELNRNVLTVNDFEQVLIDSPHIVHVSTHGSHQYKTVNKKNEFQISFEETHTLRHLIDDDPDFSAYYAVIAILFEQEINHFVQYGFDKNKKKPTTKVLKTWIWKNHTKFALLDNGKVYAMLCGILDRFGCYYRENRNAGCVEIFWGQYQYQELGELIFISSPHPPMDAYQFSSLLIDDEDVQEILKIVETDYNKSLQQNLRIAKSLRKHQKFSWEILSILLQRILFEEGAEPDDHDDTQWIVDDDNDDNINKNNNNDDDEIKGNDDDDDDDIDSDEYAEFFSDTDGDDDGDDDEKKRNNKKEEKEEDDEWNYGDSLFDDDGTRTTKVKFGKNQDLTRELKIIPIGIDRDELSDPEEMKILIEKVSHFKNKLVRLLKKTPDIQIRLDANSQSSSNIHIIRFANKHALTLAKQKVDKIKKNPKYSDEYDIEFRSISKADDSTKKQVGYIKKTQEKTYSIDIKGKTDPISRMLKKHLISRNECKIKLLVLNGCHSFILGKIFSEYVENVICIHPYVKIWDNTATTFTRYFYYALQEYTNPSTPFRHSVLKAYMEAKANVAKECPNDNACGSHSHSHHHHNHDNHNHRHNQLHLSENWNELQKYINDPDKFKKYREEMEKSGVIMNEPQNNIYDGKTLIISNVSNEEMEQIKEYLEDLKPEIHEIMDKHYNDDDDINDNNDDDDDGVCPPSFGKLRQKSTFVKQSTYQKDEHYEELSVAFFKFKTSQHRRAAIKILSQKQYDEQLQFSEEILLQKNEDDNKDNDNDNDDNDDKKKQLNLGWSHRIVPRCCCAPHHPHLAQDKLILLQDGNIINRSIIDDLSQIKDGLKDYRMRETQRINRKKQEEMRRKLQKMTILEGRDSSILSSCSDSSNTSNTSKKEEEEQKKQENDDDDDEEETNNDEIAYVDIVKKPNNFGSNVIYKPNPFISTNEQNFGIKRNKNNNKKPTNFQSENFNFNDKPRKPTITNNLYGNGNRNNIKKNGNFHSQNRPKPNKFNNINIDNENTKKQKKNKFGDDNDKKTIKARNGNNLETKSKPKIMNNF